MDAWFGTAFAVLLGFGLILLFLVFLKSPKKKTHFQNSGIKFSPEKWQEVQNMLSAGGPANFKQAIMDADKLVDAVLRARVKGETMGERLKNAKPLFPRDVYDRLWTAHKIRNKVAHEADFEGLSSDARLAVRNFSKALKELNII